MVFVPKIEGTNKVEPPPSYFLSEFSALASKVYPQDLLENLRKSKYNPVIIGYTHDGSLIQGVLFKFLEIATTVSGQLKVALEIVPKQISWIQEFLRDEEEYKKHRTIWGKKPTANLVKKLRAYRRELRQQHSEHLAIWLLENGFNVLSIEHPEVLAWVEADRRRELISGDGFFGSRWIELQPGYTAIRRDIHGLNVIDKERPDIISVGFYHALKYDLLLERNGRNSFYFIQGTIDWPAELDMWREAHTLYLRQPPK